MLVAKIPSPNKIEHWKFQPGMFFNLQAGTLLVVDCNMLENLRDATARAVQDGSFKRCGLVLLVDTKTLDSRDKLTQMNLSLRSLWSSTMVVIKPWNGGIAKAEDRMFPTSSIPHMADRIGQGIRRLPKLLRTQVCLLCMHKSGKVVSNGPPATAQAATDLWQPGPVQAAPLKRLQPGERVGRPTGEALRARGTTRGPAGAADIAADVVVAPADEAAPAVAYMGPL